jgi:hypothetical protein
MSGKTQKYDNKLIQLLSSPLNCNQVLLNFIWYIVHYKAVKRLIAGQPTTVSLVHELEKVDNGNSRW